MRSSCKFFLLAVSALGILVFSATGASAKSYGAANNVILGAQQSPMGTQMGGINYGDATFYVRSTSTKPVYDVSVTMISCPSDYSYGSPPFSSGPPPSLALLRKPPHLNPNIQSFSSDPIGFSFRWHIVKLMPGQGLSLPLRFMVPLVPSSGYVPDPTVDPSFVPPPPSPYLCVQAAVSSETDNSYGPSTSVEWASPIGQ